jgi:hypothetical protein
MVFAVTYPMRSVLSKVCSGVTGFDWASGLYSGMHRARRDLNVSVQTGAVSNAV